MVEVHRGFALMPALLCHKDTAYGTQSPSLLAFSACFYGIREHHLGPDLGIGVEQEFFVTTDQPTGE